MKKYILCDESIGPTDVLQVYGSYGLNYMCSGVPEAQAVYTESELEALFAPSGTGASQPAMSEADFNAIGGLTVSVFLIVIGIISVIRTIKIWR